MEDNWFLAFLMLKLFYQKHQIEGKNRNRSTLLSLRYLNKEACIIIIIIITLLLS